MPSPSLSFDDNLDYCRDLDRLSHRLSDPARVFAPGDELDGRLCAIPLPAGFLERMRSFALDTMGQVLCGGQLALGKRETFGLESRDSVDDSFGSIPLPS